MKTPFTLPNIAPLIAMLSALAFIVMAVIYGINHPELF